MERLAFGYDMNRCIGCGACQVTCQDQHGLPPDRKPRRFRMIEGGQTAYPYSGSCYHCGKPACVAACPAKAVYKAQDGTVQVSQEKCIGCGACVSACPYDAVALHPLTGRAWKCDACADRRREGLEPACVANCPTGCLSFGSMGQMNGDRTVRDLPHLPPSGQSDPSVAIVISGKMAGAQTAAFSSPCKSPASPIAPFGKKADGHSLPEEWALGPLGLACRLLSLFFCRREEWLAYGAHQMGVPADLSDEEYSALFWGTDASVAVPLWASVCKGPQRVFLNETTRDFIAHCKAHGYRPGRVDGNPPDYIGEQLRYLEYLAACRLEEALRDCIAGFTRPTVEAMGEALRAQTKSREVQAVLACLEALLEGVSPAFSKDIRKGLHPVKRRPAIPLEEPVLIHSAGINNCGGRCCIDIMVQEGCVLFQDNRPQKEGPHVPSCPRGKAYRHTFLNTDRLRYPMKRIGKRGEGKFRRISWAEAVEELAVQTSRVKEQYGAQARYVLYGTGSTGVMNPRQLMQRLLYLDGGALGYYNSYSSACAAYVSPYIYGDAYCGNSEDDLLHTKLLILWGHNPAETQFGSDRNRAILQARENGARVVAIDPRCSDSAVTMADEWIPIRPTTDSALADAMAYVIWSEGLQDQAFMDRFCVGFDEAHMPEGVPGEECVRAYLFGERDGIAKTPAWAEKITGVPAATIARLAREYAAAKPACLHVGLGLQRVVNGEQAIRGTAMLACLTGNVGVPGGGAAANNRCKGRRTPAFPTPPNPYPGQIPTFLWYRAVNDGPAMEPVRDGLQGTDRLESSIKALYCMASNILINQHSNINETMEILSDESKCEFIVCSDVFMTPSARWADLLLPAASVFERDDIAMPWNEGHNYLLAVNRAVEPLFECREEYGWMAELAAQAGVAGEFTQGRGTAGEWLEHLYNEARKQEPELPDYKTFRARGGHYFADFCSYIAYRDNIEQGKPFATPSGKIEIFSKRLYDMGNPEEIPGIPKYTPCVEGPEDPLTAKFPLQLIGYHTKRRTHSIHDNNALLEELDPPALWIHPGDASARGIGEGDRVAVYNGRGRVEVPARVTERIMPGVVAMSQGGWFTPDRNGTDLRGSINALTLTHKPSPLAKGNPQHTNLVEVVPV